MQFDQWQPGQQILHRDVNAGHVVNARPVTVVHDRPAELALFLAHGTQVTVVDLSWAESVLVRSGLDVLRREQWRYVSSTWRGTNVLLLTPPTGWHSVHLLWEQSSWEFRGWYVNLQSPPKRSARTLDSRDLALDIVVSPTGEWALKDEDHLARGVELGWLQRSDAGHARDEGRKVIERIEAAEYPFDRSWQDWRPEPGWPLPPLPADWARTDRHGG